jgi:uncharacterized delta-60 repeat protein
MRITVDFDSKNFQRARRIGRALLVGGALAWPIWAIASQVGPIITFGPGMPIRAADMNQNFQAVVTAIDDTDNNEKALAAQVAPIPGEITALQGQATTLQTQSTALQTQVTTLQTQNTTLQTQVTTLQTQNSTLQTQVTTLQTALGGLKFQGRPDVTFNGTGAVPQSQVEFGTTRAAQIDANGKILTAGEDLNSQEMSLRRFNADGSADTTFNAAGPSPGLALSASVVGSGALGVGIVIDSSQRIFVAGTSNANSATGSVMTVWCFTSAGVLDTTFGPNGGYVTDTAGGTASDGYGIAIDSSSGKIVVVGESDTGTTKSMAAWRFNTDGTLDTTFGSPNGFLTTLGAGSPTWGQAVLVDGSGNIVITGTTTSASNNPLIVWRFTTTGAVDTSFNASANPPGFLFETPFGSGGIGNALALDGSGRIVVAARTSNFGGAVFRILGTGPNAGTLDPTFALGIGWLLNLTETAAGSLTGVGFDANGRILVAGYDNSGAIVERVSAIGPDGSGLVSQAQAFGLVIDGQGRLVVAGETQAHEAVFRFLAQ